MKLKKIFIGTSLMVLPISYGFSMSILEAPIQHVTLYPNAANIERNIPVQSGETIITLTGLAANFDINQMQYQSNNVEIYAVTHTDSALDKPSGEESKKLLKEIEKLKYEILEKEAVIEAAHLQNEFLANLTDGSVNKVRKAAYNAFLTIDSVGLEKETLEKKLKELEFDLNKINDHQFNQRTLKFYVKADKKGEINLKYLVPYARWQPSYKVELDTKLQNLKITRMAMISQKTGEDWKNVNITLSSNSSQKYAQQLNPENWIVNYYEIEKKELQNEVVTQKRNFSNTSSPRAPAARSPFDFENTKPDFPQFEISEQSFSTEFKADAKTSISSSQQLIYLPLAVENHAAKLSIWAIPHQSKQAMIRAEVDNVQKSWPTGSVKLYRDGDYIGEHIWNNLNTNNLSLNFGVDDQVKVDVIEEEIKNVNKNNTESRVKNKKYMIQNLHSFPIALNVFDSIPQSQNSQLKVSTSYSIQPTSKEWNQRKNISQWEINLSPKQIFELNVEHQFSYPKDGRTTGF